MSGYGDIIQKLSTIHADIKNTNEKVAKIDQKVDKLDNMLRGDGTSDNVGLVAEVSNNSKSIKSLRKIEKKVAIIVIVLAVIILGGVEGAKALLRFFIPAIPQ